MESCIVNSWCEGIAYRNTTSSCSRFTCKNSRKTHGSNHFYSLNCTGKLNIRYLYSISSCYIPSLQSDRYEHSLRGLVYLTPLSTTLQLYCGASFTGRGNQNTRRKPPTCRKSLTKFITQLCIGYTSPSAGFELTTLVVIGIDCTGSCKSNYHTMTTTTAPIHCHCHCTVHVNCLSCPS